MVTPFANMFTGNNVSVEVVKAPSTGVASTGFVEIPNLASFPQAGGSEAQIIEVKVFGELYSRKIPGSRKTPDIDLKINWIPGNEVHEQLSKFAEDAELVQIRITYFEDVSHKNGYFIVLNGYFTSNVCAGDMDKVVTLDYKFSVSGSPVKRGLIDPALPAV